MYKCWEMLTRIQYVCNNTINCDNCVMNSCCGMDNQMDVIYNMTDEKLQSIDEEYIRLKEEKGEKVLPVTELNSPVPEDFDKNVKDNKSFLHYHRYFIADEDNIMSLNNAFDAGCILTNYTSLKVGNKEVLLVELEREG